VGKVSVGKVVFNGPSSLSLSMMANWQSPKHVLRCSLYAPKLESVCFTCAKQDRMSALNVRVKHSRSGRTLNTT
jgi:hypothetical protein